MTPSLLQFLGGLVLLLVGGRLLVSASVDAATRLRVSPLVVGLTLVAWGTSAPEVALNLISASKGRGDLALGNVVGANICNMALVLGVCAVLKPLRVQERLINVEIWLNAALLATMAGLGLFLGFTWWKAAFMLGLFCIYSLWAIIAAMLASAAAPTPAAADTLGPDPADTPKLRSRLMIVLCFAGAAPCLCRSRPAQVCGPVLTWRVKPLCGGWRRSLVFLKHRWTDAQATS